MPDLDDDAVDWLTDQANAAMADPEEDDEESPGACDEMWAWDLEGEEDEEGEAEDDELAG